MLSEIPDVLQAWLGCVKSTNQNDAITLLAILGLKYYTLIFPQQFLDERRLRRTALQDIEELLSLLDSLILKSRRNLSQCNQSHDFRRSRLDAMSHYPFADDNGNVKMVLMDDEERKKLSMARLVEMGKPGRNRFIQRVYDEMKYDKKGIKLNDLPEALQRLGIKISSKLRNNLLHRTSLNHVTQYDEEQKSYVPEAFVQELLWKKIVNTFYRLIKQGYDPASVDSLDIDTQGLKSMDTSDTSNLYGASNAGEDVIEVEKIPIRIAKKSDADSKKNPAKNISEQSTSYFSRLKRVPSRIGPEIRRDRAEYSRSNQKIERIAASTLARRRLHMLTSTASGPSSARRRESSSRSNPISSGVKTYQNVNDLNSGVAALGIAESFLNSSVGKELLSNKDERASKYMPPTKM